MTIPRREVLRYLGYKKEKPPQEVSDAIDRIEKELISVATPRTVFREIAAKDVLWNCKTVSKALGNCNCAVVFAATIGASVDRLLSRYESINMGDAVILQALAAAMIEEVCDELQAKYKSCPRVSPGYGDFGIEAQKEILKMLDAPKKIGLTATESLMLVPTKSVTAIFGIEED